MPVTQVLQILVVCEQTAPTASKAGKSLQRKLVGSCVHKGINGFFLGFDNFYLGMFEGPQKKVLAQVEGLVRNATIINIDVLSENLTDQAEWQSWFQAGNDLAELPDVLIDQTEGLAQIVAHKLNAGQK